MASPYNVPAVTAYPLVSNLLSLASGAAKGLGIVGTAQVQFADDLAAPMVMRTTGATSGSIERYLVLSEDGSIFDDGINPNATTDQSGLIYNARLVDQLNINFANPTTVRFKHISIWEALQGYGCLPSFWAWVIYNKTGQAFDATSTNFSCQHTLIAWA